MPDFLTGLCEQVAKVLDADRYQHTLGVRYTSCALAMAHGADLWKAQVAGILHDCAKSIPNEEKLRLCIENHLEVKPCEAENPSLLHAKLGRFFAETRYGIEDEEILSAIEYHTTGRPDMTLLEEIVFVADYIEPYRDTEYKLPYCDEMRACAFTDLKKAVYLELKATLERIRQKGSAIDEMTQSAYEYYKKEYESIG